MDSVCNMDTELVLKHLKEMFSYPMWQWKKPSDLNIRKLKIKIIFWFSSYPLYKQQMFYYSHLPQAIVTCVLSITKGFCLKRLYLSHVFACETAVHLGHILGHLKMCHFQHSGFTLFYPCVTAVIRSKELMHKLSAYLQTSQNCGSRPGQMEKERASGNGTWRMFGPM